MKLTPEQLQTIAWLQHVNPRKRNAHMVFTFTGPLFVPPSLSHLF